MSDHGHSTTAIATPGPCLPSVLAWARGCANLASVSPVRRLAAPAIPEAAVQENAEIGHAQMVVGRSGRWGCHNIESGHNQAERGGKAGKKAETGREGGARKEGEAGREGEARKEGENGSPGLA